MSAKVNIDLNAANDILQERTKQRGFAKLACREYYTPDFPKLRMQKQMLYFAWGDEKSGRDGDKLLDGAIPLGNAHTLISKYVMREDSYGPALFEKTIKLPEAHVARGEAYLVSVEHLHNLDVKYMNTILSSRVPRNIGFDNPWIDSMTPERFKGKARGTAWMYVADERSVSYDLHGDICPTEIDLTLVQSEVERYYYIW